MLLMMVVAQQLNADQLAAQVDAANPNARAAQFRVAAARSTVRRAWALDEPLVGVQLKEVPTDPRMWMTPKAALAQPMVMGQVGWMVPLSGMPFSRARMAEAMADMARADERMTRVGLRRVARVAFWELWLNTEALRINTEAAETLAAIEESALAQYASGKPMHHGVLRVQAERELIKVEALTLEQQSGALVALINSLRATPSAKMEILNARLTPRRVMDEPQLMAQAVSARPELAMARARQASAQAERTMAMRALIPDPMVMAMAEARPLDIPTGMGAMGVPLPMTPMVGVGITIPLPVFAPWRQLTDADAARSRERAAVEDGRAAEQTIAAELRTVLVRVSILEQREELIVKSLEPRAHESLEAALAALGAGQASALEVLESRRQLQGIELELATVRAEREAALAELDAVLGVAGPEVRP